MEILHLPDNIKVHYAGVEIMNEFLVVPEVGISYALFTCFPFVDKAVFGKTKSPIMPLRTMKNPAVEIPRIICDNMRHVIQDSGLYTLMFGSHKGTCDEKMIHKWYDGVVEFTLNHGRPCTCVEVDCQKIIGAEKTWEFREKIKKDLPNNRIINAYHIEDGRKGLDRMIEFSDYIAVSVQELRFLGKKEYAYALASYIKEKKPEIDIHLLGCTDFNLLKKCSFCTSCDSTSWLSSMRYGYVSDYASKHLDIEKVKQFFGEDSYNTVYEYLPKNAQNLLLYAEFLKRKYEKYAGNQDFHYIKELTYKQKTTK